MTIEFVVIDNWVETDWIDPVIDMWEFSDHWRVDNGFNLHIIDKVPGREVVTRPLTTADDFL